ncbi:protein of unknown function DUF748 [Anaeromyxobacter dehalogenans 2CP-1]|uniref:DUF748 domain-containing protein n=1 Tax=Anaeromyxobacter dehalogenans (strain ATCC BAA-258 / DSM 21875 / 2CP-1) TaxID=455488 RepID=B8J677_ANAD2|nr:DUF748 domain-containing protein [Anaeromyxobacter dehalogenans]ACL66972.1 protein of unknown function DUF748 [Anaeromyxobacter dehalogenans 2CP-1]
MSDTTPKAPRRRRWLRAAALLGGLLCAYTALGFLAAPSLVRRVAVKQASAALHRPVEIDRVRINPLALSVTVEGLRVKHGDGAPFAAWDSLYVRLAPLRLLAGDVGFAEIRLVRPALHVGLDARGALTFEDLLAGDPAAAKAGAPAAPAKQGGLGLSIRRLAVEEARVVFRDATRKPAFETTLGPLTVRLDSFRTRGGGDSPYSFTGTTESGETFRWTGTVRSAPLRSSGTLAFERIQLPKYAPYIHDQAPVDLAEGVLDLETAYELAWGADARVLRTSGGKLTVERLALAPRGQADAPVRLPRVEVAGIQVDALAKQASVATVAVRGGAVRARLEQDGTLELARMAPPPSPASPEPWRWSVGALEVSGLAVDVEDRSTARPVRLPLTEVAVKLEGIRPGPETACPLAASLAWNGRGRLAVKGEVRPFGDRGTLALEAEALDLVPLAPYLDTSLVAQLTAGRAGAKATIGYDLAGQAPRWTFAGDVRLDALAVAEAGNEDLLRWRALEVTGIDAASTPPRAAVRRVRLLEPRVKAYVWEDGATSVARALRPASAPAAPAPAGPAWRTSIGSVEVAGGRLALVDRSVTPAAVVNLTGGQATVTRLSSDPTVRSSVDVRLQVEGASPVRVTGTLNPLQKEAYTELVVASEGVDLSPLGPYAGKFLGYGLQKGKLDLDLKYTVVNRALTSTNVVRVNQLTLGDKTESPDATKVPVRLALALLQDREGVILLDVPVEGNLDDPEFRLGKVIWRTILNVLVKVATSPFTALASLVGGDQADLSLVEFTPGTAEPLPAAKERIALLARSLGQRPTLGLELEGSADAAQDGAALRRAALERALRRARAETLRTAPASLDEVTLGAEERVRLVKAAYHAAFPAAPPAQKGEAAPAPTPQEMEERLAAAAQVPEDAYRALAAERAQRAREALIAAGLDQARLFLAQGGERARKEGGARVYFSVR